MGEEFEKAIEELKRKKPPGKDELPAEKPRYTLQYV